MEKILGQDQYDQSGFLVGPKTEEDMDKEGRQIEILRAIHGDTQETVDQLARCSGRFATEGAIQGLPRRSELVRPAPAHHVRHRRLARPGRHAKYSSVVHHYPAHPPPGPPVRLAQV